MSLDRTLLETLFGKKNIATWADLDNDKDQDAIDARIAYALSWAPSYLTSLTLTRPMASITSVVVEDLLGRLAGIWLYENRGITGEDQTTSPIAHHRTYTFRWIKSYLVGSANTDTLPTGPVNIE